MRKIKTATAKLPDFIGILKWCIGLSWQASKFYTAARMLSDALVPILSVIIAFIGRSLINLLAGQAEYSSGPEHMLILFVGSLFLIAIIRSLSVNVMQYIRSMHEDMMNAKIASIIMDHALKSDIAYFDDPDYYDKLNSANRDSYAINHVVWNTMSIISSAVSFAIAFSVLSQMNLIYGIALLIAAIPSSVAAAQFTKALYTLSLEQINGMRQMGYVQGISSDRLFSQEFRLYDVTEQLKSRYYRIWKGLFAARRGKSRKRTIFVSAFECLPELAISLISIDIALRVIAGNATVGDYSLFVGMTAQLWGAISMFSTSAMQIYDNRMQLDNFRSLDVFSNRIEDTGRVELNEVHAIEFEGVSFSYPGTEFKAIDDLNIKLRKNEKTAIVGLNGSGKSTFVKLLLRLYDTDEGMIYINGKSIKEYTIKSLRANFSVYFQEMNNLSFSLRDNFIFTDNGIDEEDIDMRAEEALEKSGSTDILERCSSGFDTNITRYFSNDGMELSGGQHQKLALARTLYRRHTCIILDEPSSNLDAKAEHDIFETLKEITDDKMTIFTSHRLSNTFLADRIIVLEKGRVIEDGTKAELLKNEMRFAELYKYQSDKFKADD